MPNQFTKIDNKNSLKYLYPKIAKEWDIAKNEIDIDIITYGSRRKVWWLCPKNHSYEALVKSRTILKSNCPYCSNQKAGYGNDLETNFPNIAKEWDVERNKIPPSQITPGSKKKVWWLCPKNHSYSSQVYDRTKKNTGCHFCSNLKAGYGNDLETNFPNIAKEWDMEKNKISPTQVTAGSEKKVWWLCPKKHSFKSAIKTKVKHPNLCPYCSNHKVGYGNDLESTHPDLIKEWDFTKNKIDPSTVTKGHRARVWWLCPKKHSYDETIKTRTVMKTNCPFCAGQRVGFGNDLESTHPKLVKE